MPTLPALDLKHLLDGVPRGAWVAISMREDRVIAYGSDMRAVLEESRAKGEADPVITRVPESCSTLVL